MRKTIAEIAFDLIQKGNLTKEQVVAGCALTKYQLLELDDRLKLEELRKELGYA